MRKEKQIIVRYTVRQLPTKIFSTENLRADLINGKLPLKAVPKKFRLRDEVFYIYAMKYYNYRQNIDNPYDVFYKDICSLSEGYRKEQLIDLYNSYGIDIGVSYEQRKLAEETNIPMDTTKHFLEEMRQLSHNTENLILGTPGRGHSFAVHRRLLGRGGRWIG